MNRLDEILEFNRAFVENREYEPYRTDRFPDKRWVILTCMDTRLTELLPRALNVRNGDVKLVKNAGAVVAHPFDSVMRSILVAVYELKADEVCVIGHHGCGMAGLQPESILGKMKDRGISGETLSMLRHSGVDLDSWLQGFASVEASVKRSVEIIQHHPLMPRGIPVHGLVIHPETGKLDVVVRGY